jgi:hypothetical protein
MHSRRQVEHTEIKPTMQRRQAKFDQSVTRKRRRQPPTHQPSKQLDNECTLTDAASRSVFDESHAQRRLRRRRLVNFFPAHNRTSTSTVNCPIGKLSSNKKKKKL